VTKRRVRSRAMQRPKTPRGCVEGGKRARARPHELPLEACGGEGGGEVKQADEEEDAGEAEAQARGRQVECIFGRPRSKSSTSPEEEEEEEEQSGQLTARTGPEMATCAPKLSPMEEMPTEPAEISSTTDHSRCALSLMSS
jgi:hypothetical protein